MSEIQIKVSKENQEELFGASCERIGKIIFENPKYLRKTNNRADDFIIMCKDTIYIDMLCAVDADIKVKGFKCKIKDGRGQKHLFIYDTKLKLFLTKNKNKLLVPHFLTIPIAIGQGRITEEQSTDLWCQYFKKYGKFDDSNTNFDDECLQRRAENYTGNHYRNKNINVPKSVYGDK